MEMVELTGKRALSSRIDQTGGLGKGDKQESMSQSPRPVRFCMGMLLPTLFPRSLFSLRHRPRVVSHPLLELIDAVSILLRRNGRHWGSNGLDGVGHDDGLLLDEVQDRLLSKEGQWQRRRRKGEPPMKGEMSGEAGGGTGNNQHSVTRTLEREENSCVERGAMQLCQSELHTARSMSSPPWQQPSSPPLNSLSAVHPPPRPQPNVADRPFLPSNKDRPFPRPAHIPACSVRSPRPSPRQGWEAGIEEGAAGVGRGTPAETCRAPFPRLPLSSSPWSP